MNYSLNNIFIKIDKQEDWIKVLLILNTHLPNLNEYVLDNLLDFTLDKPHYLYISGYYINCVATFISKSMFYNIGCKELTLTEIYDYDKQ